MISRELTIINRLGLHARATAKLVKLVHRFDAEVKLTYAGKSANARSMMSVMMLAAAQGSEIVFTVEGRQEKDCMDAIENLIHNRFDETE